MIILYIYILRYTKHVQSICGRNFDEHIISIQALVSIWHAALHEARSQDEQKTLEGTRWKSVWEVNQPCVTWGQCFKGNNLSRIVKACKSHDFCFKNPLTNGPGWPGHSYDQLTSLLDPPSSSHPRWVALMSPKKRPPAFAWATCSGAPNLKTRPLWRPWRVACCLVVSMVAWNIRWQLCRLTYHWKPRGFLKFT